MAIVTTFKQKALASALAALTLGAGIAMSPNAAQARFDRNGWAAAGVIGGLALGALAAGAAQADSHQSYYPDPGYDVAPSAPAYQPAYYDGPTRRPTYYGGPARTPSYYGEPAYDGDYRPHRHHHWRRGPNRMEADPTFAYKGPDCRLERQSWFDGYAWRVQKVPVCR